MIFQIFNKTHLSLLITSTQCAISWIEFGVFSLGQKHKHHHLMAAFKIFLWQKAGIVRLDLQFQLNTGQFIWTFYLETKWTGNWFILQIWEFGQFCTNTNGAITCHFCYFLVTNCHIVFLCLNIFNFTH